MVYALLFSAFLIGFTSMVGQILLMRELIIVFYGNELSLGVILSGWLFWVGIGSWVLGRLSDRIQRQLALFISHHFLTFAILPILIFAVRNLRNVLNTMPGEIIGFLPMLVSSFVILAPLCVLLGFGFALACRILADVWEKSARSIGQIYILEAVGAGAGGLSLNFILIPYLTVYKIVFLVGILNLIAPLLLVSVCRVASGGTEPRRYYSPVAKRIFIILTSLLIFATVLAFPLGWVDRLEEYSAQRQWGALNLVQTKNSIYGNIAVTSLDGEQYSFYENGLLMYTTGDKFSAELSVHFAMLEHPSPENVLLIGGGVGGALEQILKHPVKKVDYLEIDPLIIQTAEKYLSDEEAAFLSDERVTLKHADARLFIKRTIEEGRPTLWDVILVNLPDPFTAQINRFYSLEFCQDAYQILSPGGILSLGITSSENYLSHEQQDFLRSLYATMRKVFDSVKVIPGSHNYLIGRKADGTSKQIGGMPDYNILIKRLKERNLKNLFVHEYYLPVRLSKGRVEYISRVVSDIPESTRINRDFRPIGYFYDMVLWSLQFYQRSLVVRLIKGLASFSFWHWLIPIASLIGVFLFFQLRNRSKDTRANPVILAIGTTGFSEITFQVVVILAFQVLYGYVYYKLCLILASFMIGLVLGGWYVNRILNRLKNALSTYIKTQIAICIYPLILLPIFALLAAYGGKIPTFLRIDTVFAFLPVIAGFIGGVQFPLASKICLKGREVGRTAGFLYGIDLLGSCLGALLASAILIPILGIFHTCLLVATLNFGVLVLLLINHLQNYSPSKGG